MHYIVQVVGDHDLPEGIDHVIVERESEPAVLILSGGAARCWTLMRDYEDTIEPRFVPSISVPAPRPLRAV